MAVEEAMKSGDIDDIEAKTKTLTEVSSSLAEKMYAEKQAGEAGAADDASAQSSDNDDAVDAEFEEVKDDK